MYNIQYKKSATKVLARMPKKTAYQFLAAFEQLAKNEGNENMDIKKLENRMGFRLRIGAYRALYRVLEDMLVIEVVKIG